MHALPWCRMVRCRLQVLAQLTFTHSAGLLAVAWALPESTKGQDCRKVDGQAGRVSAKSPEGGHLSHDLPKRRKRQRSPCGEAPLLLCLLSPSPTHWRTVFLSKPSARGSMSRRMGFGPP